MKTRILSTLAILSLIFATNLLTACDDDDDDDGEIAAPTVSDSSASGTAGTNSDEYVDLGLSVKWARYNVGASTPDDYGDYFAWCDISAATEADISIYEGTADIAGNDTYDAATAAWGSAWKMPTQAQLEELKNDCTWTWGTYDGTSIKGFLVTGSNGNSIFLPAAGYVIVSSETVITEADTTVVLTESSSPSWYHAEYVITSADTTVTYTLTTSYAGTTAFYSSSTPDISDAKNGECDNAYFLYLYNSAYQQVSAGDKEICRSIRAVTE